MKQKLIFYFLLLKGRGKKILRLYGFFLRRRGTDFWGYDSRTNIDGKKVFWEKYNPSEPIQDLTEYLNLDNSLINRYGRLWKYVTKLAGKNNPLKYVEEIVKEKMNVSEYKRLENALKEEKVNPESVSKLLSILDLQST